MQDSAVVPSVRGQTWASVSVRLVVQPWELPSPSGVTLPAILLLVVRGVGSSTGVSGSFGSYRPIIAGTKLGESTTTILSIGNSREWA